MMVSRGLLFVAAVALVAAACSDSDGGEATTAPITPTAATTETLPPATSVITDRGTLIQASAGGTVVSDDGLLTLDIPAGALADDTAFAIVQLEPGDVDTGDAIVVGPLYDLQPSGLTFAAPVTVTQELPGAGFDDGVPLLLQSVRDEAGSWEPLTEATIRPGDGSLVITSATTHFSEKATTQVKTEDGEPAALVRGSTGGDLNVGDYVGVDWRLTDPSAQYGLRFAAVDESGPFKRVASTGPGYFGRCTAAGSFAVPAFPSDAEFAVEQLDGGEPDFTIFDGGGDYDLKIGFDDFADITRDCLPSDPPDGTQAIVALDFAARDEANCGTGFSQDILMIFGGDNRDGSVFFTSELEGGADFAGRPFQRTGDEVVIDRFEFPVSQDLSVFETWLLDLVAGTGTLESEFDDDVCVFDVTFDPAQLAFIDDVVLADTPETPTPGDCTPGDTTMCLNNGRFQVSLDWFDGVDRGTGRVEPLVPTSGLFFFVDVANLATFINIADGCSFNDHFWVFAAATTDVEYTLNVTDTVSGESRTYGNDLGQPAKAITDTSAFATCP